MKKLFRHLKWSFLTFLALGMVIMFCDLWVRFDSRSATYKELAQLPNNKVALVLGTSKKTVGGTTNLFFKYRIDAAVKLYKAGKVRHILVSGDNRTKFYDEASDMRDALIAKGVPRSAITLDYAGFRTFDSIVRAQKVFGQDQFTIVSQKFHNERALFIAHAKGIHAIAYNAKDLPKGYSPKTFVREYLARVKAVMDVYVLGTQPKFLGDPVKINV